MHFYTETDNGVEPRHFVPMTKDPSQLRPSRLSDMKKAGKNGEKWLPSVTTILDVLGKPGLVNWKIDQHLRQAYQNPSPDDTGNTNEDVQNYISEIKRLTELEMDKAPSAGSDFHASIEAFFNGDLDSKHDDYSLCMEVERRLFHDLKLTPDAIFKTEVNFVAGRYGGQIDLIIEDINSDWIIDFKTKREASKFKPGKMVYVEHLMQLGAYQGYADFITGSCANVFVCLEDGQIDVHTHDKNDISRGGSMFFSCLDLFYLKNKLEI